MPIYISPEDLADLFKSDVKDRKITSIKTIRHITGLGLKEAKEFCENIVIPASKGLKRVQVDLGDDTGKVPDEPLDGGIGHELAPPMFLVGHNYEQLDGKIVVILGHSNPNTSYETVYTMDENGFVIHRYNRRDFGRCTGSDFEIPDQRNLKVLS